MDKLRTEKSQTDQSPIEQTPEFQQALEKAKRDILAERSQQPTNNTDVKIEDSSVTAGFGSQHPDVQKTLLHDSKAVPQQNLEAAVLQRTMDMLSGNEDKTLYDDKSKSSKNAQETVEELGM